MAYYGKTNFGQIKYIDMKLSDVILEFLESALCFDEFCIADLSTLLTESINIDGSYTCNKYKAKEQVNAWDREEEDLLELVCLYYKNELGMDIAMKYFENIEAFQVLVIMAVLEQFIFQSETIIEYDIDSTIKGKELEQFIKKLIDELNEYGCEFSYLFE